MRFQELEDAGIPEVVPELEEELSEIDIPTEIKFWNFVFCVGLVLGVLLGCWCILSDPLVIEKNPEIFFFTLFYISVEVACAIISVLIFLCYWAITYLKDKKILISDYIGILSVISFAMSGVAHLLAIPIGCLLLARNPVIPVSYKTFICFQILFAIFILGKFLFRTTSKSKSSTGLHLDAIKRATLEIENIRSRGNSLHSLQSSFQGGREIRSTSNYEGKREEDKAVQRERSMSTGKRLRLKVSMIKAEETNKFPN
jgi:hypothetical protein